MDKCKITSFYRIKNPITLNYSLRAKTLYRQIVIKQLGINSNTPLTFNNYIEIQGDKALELLGIIL